MSFIDIKDYRQHKILINHYRNGIVFNNYVHVRKTLFIHYLCTPNCIYTILINHQALNLFVGVINFK